MKMRLAVLVGLALLASGRVSASTVGHSAAVTGAPNPAASELIYAVFSNRMFEIVGIIPVVSTVTGSAASMAASINVGAAGPFNICGAGSPSCNNDIEAATKTRRSEF